MDEGETMNLPNWLCGLILVYGYSTLCSSLAAYLKVEEEIADSSWRWSNWDAEIVSEEFPGPY